MTPLLLLALLPTSAAHVPSDGDAPAGHARRAHDGLLEQFRALTAPTHAADAAHEGHGGVCLTPLVASLKDNWELFDAAERAEMTRVLAPWKQDLLDPMLPPGGPDGAPPPAGVPCHGNYGAYLTVGEHFSVEWDSGVTDATAESFLEALEYSWDVEIEEIGWKKPSGTPTYPLLVYIQAASGYAGAYTTVEYCSGIGYVPYIVAGSGSFSAGTWYKTMAAHEFNHAVQFAYGFSHEFWWWEASASYAEEDVFPTLNDWSDFTPYYGMYPYVGMNASAGNSNDYLLFYHTYAMGIFGFHLDEYYGGPDAVIETWERSATSNGQYDYWIPDAVEDTGLDFEEVYAHFLANNTVMDYEEGRYFGDVEIEDEFSSLPADGESGGRTAPQSLGANFWKIDDGAVEAGDTLEVEFSGDDGVDWVVVLVRAGDDGVAEWVQVEVVDGVGSGSIAADGEDDLYLVASPIDEDAQGYYYSWSSADTYDYSFSLQAGGPAETGDDGGDSGAVDDGPAGSGFEGDDDPIGLCACSAGVAAAPSGALGLLGLVGVVSLARRRRRG